MLFIQALEKVQTKPIGHIRVPKRLATTHQKESIDIVDLSDSISPVISINKSNIIEDNMTMDIEATALQQVFLYLSGLPIPMYSIRSLELTSDEWQLELQKPPRTSPTQMNRYTTSYSNNIRHSLTEIINYPFSMEVISSDRKKHNFNIDIRVARFTQQDNKWPQEGIERISLLPVELSYNSATLNTAEKQLTFFFDQDGSENQAQSILDSMRLPPTTELLRNNTFFQGMRVWRSSVDPLDIALIGDPHIGAIHTATYQNHLTKK